MVEQGEIQVIVGEFLLTNVAFGQVLGLIHPQKSHFPFGLGVAALLFKGC